MPESSSAPGAIPVDMRRALARSRRAENFPVALSVLPRVYRRDLLAIYAVARTIDDLGDAADGDRTALLRAFGVELAGIWTGEEPTLPVLRELSPVVGRLELKPAPFEDLIQANILDQTVVRYRDFDGLLAYCALSAYPIGRLVLAVFGVRDPALEAMSDQVCAALQVIEHCQDIGEDYRAGRIYLPEADLAAVGVPEFALGAATTSPRLRRLLMYELGRAAGLLAAGDALVRALRGWARVAVAGYVAGGWATIDALRRPAADPLAKSVTPRRMDVLRHGAVLLSHKPREVR